ncbi:amino acid ABC transporter ATP-binding protein [Clostridium gasigenes]|uniref:Amino acid ABC transporter ATP-binding protein, PAAT family n=1 Tax=Clostridium gasigenes TaxID=94869 RepID=A0A1H0VEL4_9CLOT|nr:amino acid ABC transporter ATP-binding protein [Clostridium gasigenes]MBB6624849.1 amino acid ABC transporter ATP-binding protein [Clostridium gasigenes]MBU3089854.1 amino acid ABC transporter ATP-binding protein [Clostridium gasigenes]MBU3105177.1 amino acid ABC transporter ATP-binding protein [Clostridium gasigenes]MBU3107599.1 amino acid ABC transporter ATP-binding protein [Clostridium gasigenes]SDP76992.1 amino acid ABC transporter ATP-binding protein, PAAT family [Clostridium gasigenes
MLKISGLKKSFGKTEVLKGVDLEIKSGEILVIVGPSGGGKTTLLRCVNALETCDDGLIEINGNTLCENGKYIDKIEMKNIRKDIGLVFQNFNLFPHMSVLENLIEAPQKVFGVSKEEAIKRAEETLSFLGLNDKRDNYPCELSGGQKQRVAIGRALVLDPKLMCFDEPTSALDPGLTDEVAKLIRSLGKEGMSMMIITHDMEFAKKVADRIFSMDKGILSEGLIFKDLL